MNRKTVSSPAHVALVRDLDLDRDRRRPAAGRRVARAGRGRRSACRTGRGRRGTAARPADRGTCWCSGRPDRPAARSALGVEDRDLPDVDRPGHGQPAGRVVAAAHHVADRMAGLAAEEPGGEHRIGALEQRGRHQRPAGATGSRRRACRASSTASASSAWRPGQVGPARGSPPRRSSCAPRRGTAPRRRPRAPDRAPPGCRSCRRRRSRRPARARSRAAGKAARRPSRMVTMSSGRPAAAQGPSISARASASGPSTATAPPFAASGSTPPRLVSSTIARRAASRASLAMGDAAAAGAQLTGRADTGRRTARAPP